MKKYLPAGIEPKWQKKWKEDSLYLTDLSATKNKYYVLVELPYTSGDLHMGHWFTFTMGDILARFKKRQGFNVLFPNGFDAFGLPAENAAIKKGVHPRDWTYDNIKRMRDQFETMGASIDWSKTAVTADPEYYKWNQWIFLKMFEKGIAYRGKAMANWCPKDATVLADENIEDGKCWRCSTEVVKKEVSQWFLKLTYYADRLLWQDPPQADWPKPLRVAQNDWIGKSEGVGFAFPIVIASGAKQSSNLITVFTTALDTIFGVTFMVVSPENPLLAELVTKEQKKAVDEYVKLAGKKSELERKENKDKTGVFTGSYVTNPFNNEKVPVWVADYVLASYGTGAVMGVPGHDARDHEFAKAFGLEIKPVIRPQEGVSGAKVETDGFWDYTEIKGQFADKSVLLDSGKYSGLTSKEAKKRMSDYIEKNKLGKRQTQYHLHDWSISRQRYWGTPIPMIHCDKCGIVPVPEKDLPVELPYEVDYTPQGKPPLATAQEWMNVSCPKCGGAAKRDTETMDGFVDNSWYFYRYLDEHNSKEIFDKKKIADWMPLEIYIGGAEHTVGHTLYSRFFTKFFHDLGLVSFDEYAKKRVHHGVILGPDGARMSKSRGNVVNPDEEVKSYGADAIRLYLMFLGPFDIVAPWNPDGVNGAYHFLQRVWGLQEKVINNSVSLRAPKGRGNLEDRQIASAAYLKKDSDVAPLLGMTMVDLKMMHKTIKKVTEDIEQLKFNTAIASLMEWLNHLSRKDKISTDEYKTFLLLLAPFAPHITEELWQNLKEKLDVRSEKIDDEIGNLKLEDQISNIQPQNPVSNLQHPTSKWSVHKQTWPQFDKKYLEEGEMLIPVQINGKVRNILKVKSDILSNRSVVEKMAQDDEKIKKFLKGKSVKKIVYIPNKIISFVVSNN